MAWQVIVKYSVIGSWRVGARLERRMPPLDSSFSSTSDWLYDDPGPRVGDGERDEPRISTPSIRATDKITNGSSGSGSVCATASSVSTTLIGGGGGRDSV
ncbi:MAG: hypothetical protein V2I33_24300 [Kangiellaceae bacterium]|nr:hypothetical protein [Kangiellaceae bacterium]